MEALIIYIVKTGICLGIFLIIYTLFLRQTTFFRFNRLFLLLGFMASLILPFVKYTYDVTMPVTLSGTINSIKENELAVSNTNIQIWNIVLAVYLLGILVIVLKNIYAYYKLSGLIKGGTKFDNEGFKLIDNMKVGSPFSVLNYILLNTSKLSQTEKDVILKHEIVHVRQKHWIDLLCSEFIIMIQWFNPLAWIYVQLLKENHEFLADKAVLESGVSPVIYQAVLVNQEFKEPVFSFSNSFNYSKSLKRLSMMKKTKSSPWKKALVLTVVPVFGLFLWASAEPHYVIEQQLSVRDSVHVIGYGSTKDINQVPVQLNDKAIYIVDNVRKESIDNIDPNTIESINVLKGESAKQLYGDEGKNGVVIIVTKGQGEADANKALLIIDGVVKEGIDINSLNPDNIESVSVLKENSATQKYGKKGKNGVIEVITKK